MPFIISFGDKLAAQHTNIGTLLPKIQSLRDDVVESLEKSRNANAAIEKSVTELARETPSRLDHLFGGIAGLEQGMHRLGEQLDSSVSGAEKRAPRAVRLALLERFRNRFR